MAVKALGRLGGDEVLETLGRMLDDEEWVVSNEARAALTDRIAALKTPQDPRNLSVLLRLLTVPHREVRAAAINALGEIPAEQAGALHEALDMPSKLVREGVVTALGMISPLAFLGAILDGARDPHPEVRRAAASSLRAVEDHRAAMRLAELLEDSHHEVVDTAIESLVRMSGTALGSLRIALRHTRSGFGKANMLKVLGLLGNPGSLPVIVAHMTDSLFMVRNAAVEAVLAFGKGAVKPLVGMTQTSSSPITAIVEEALGGTSRRVRIRAIRALGELGNHYAVEPLKQLAADQDILVAKPAQEALQKLGCAAWGRACAADALGRLGEHEEVVPALIDALDDPSHHVRAAAVRALGRLGEVESAFDVLAGMLTDPYEDVRMELALALQTGATATPAFVKMSIDALHDPSRIVRSRAARALGRINDLSAAPALMEGLQDRYARVRRDCRNALMNVGEGVVPSLLEALPQADSTVATSMLEIIEAVGTFDSAPAVEAVVPQLHDKEIATEAVRIASALKKRLRP
jgi:HEAT repeat protein